MNETLNALRAMPRWRLLLGIVLLPVTVTRTLVEDRRSFPTRASLRRNRARLAAHRFSVGGPDVPSWCGQWAAGGSFTRGRDGTSRARKSCACGYLTRVTFEIEYRDHDREVGQDWRNGQRVVGEQNWGLLRRR